MTLIARIYDARGPDTRADDQWATGSEMMANTEMIRTAIADAPRVGLGFWPTPLEPCRRLRDEIGGPLVWLKRDDCSGLATGGNKTRKLEYLLGAANESDASGVVTFGALQSNHARQTAAACARVGLPCHLVLTTSVDRHDDHYVRSGNRLLDDLLGATVHVVADPVEALERVDALVGADRRLAVIEPGGSNPTGVLGYVAGAAELVDQCADRGIRPTDLVLAASTGGTSAGLIAGFALNRGGPTVRPVAVFESAAATAASIDRLVRATAAVIGLAADDAAVSPVDDGFLGPGYGVPTPESRRAIDLLARTEGVLLDPVYTAKAFAWLLDGIEREVLGPTGDVVFLHTGGQVGLFAYTDDLSGDG